MHQHICQYCGEMFESPGPRKIHCGKRECVNANMRAWRQNNLGHACPDCGKTCFSTVSRRCRDCEKKFKLSQPTHCQVCGTEVARKASGKPSMRCKDHLYRPRTGETLRTIANTVGLSYERVRQLIEIYKYQGIDMSEAKKRLMAGERPSVVKTK